MVKTTMKKSGINLGVLITLCLAACSGGKAQSGGDSSQMRSFGNNSNSNILLGAGNSSAYALFSTLFSGYAKETHVMVNYQSIGSDGGVLQLANKAVDFAETGAPLSSGQANKINSQVLQITLFGQTTSNISRGALKSGLTEAIIYKEQNYDGRSLMRAQKLLKMLWWCVHDGQSHCSGPDCAKLSPAAVTIAENILKSATFDGKPILQ